MNDRPSSIPTSQDLVNVSAALATAVQSGFFQRQHAEGIMKKALDLSGYNTPKPEKKQQVDSVVTEGSEETTVSKK